jgi:hypothetical protein
MRSNMEELRRNERQERGAAGDVDDSGDGMDICGVVLGGSRSSRGSYTPNAKGRF